LIVSSCCDSNTHNNTNSGDSLVVMDDGDTHSHTHTDTRSQNHTDTDTHTHSKTKCHTHTGTHIDIHTGSDQ